jgi:hypothetical protein
VKEKEGIKDQAAKMKRAAVVLKKYECMLLAKNNVVGVGVEYRHIQGEMTGTVAVVVMASQKLPPESLSVEDVIPDMLDNIPVDVQQVGNIVVQATD